MDAIELDILLPALLAGLLVLATHIPLGMQVLARGVIFADLAVAQFAGLGLVLAGLLHLSDRPLLVQAIAAASALLGAALLAWIDRRLPEIKEACIGLSFVLAASGGILLMSHDVHAGEHLQDLLVGQILWVGNRQLAATAVLSALLLAAWRWLSLLQAAGENAGGRAGGMGGFGFYALFALAVTASVQLVGVYLVFASLIVPALATCRLQRWRTGWAFGVGVTGYAAGLLLSAWLDLPGGAAIVWAMALAGGLAAWLTSPRKAA